MTLVSTYTVATGGVVNFTFSSIPQTGTDLLVLWSARSETTNANIDFIPNTTGYGSAEKRLQGTGSAANTGNSFNARMTLSTDTASTFANGSVYFANYSATGTKVSSHDQVTENNATAAYQQLGVISHDTTAAITNLLVRGNGGQDIAEGSTFSLYTITKGSGGATVS